MSNGRLNPTTGQININAYLFTLPDQLMKHETVQYGSQNCFYIRVNIK